MLETLEIGAAGETPAARLSVIIPSFNCGHLLQRSVRSAFAISTPGLEVIVIDDGSTDNT